VAPLMAHFIWLSFASEDAFLGCVLARANHLDDAIAETKRLGINPGHQVQSFEMDETLTNIVAAKLDPKWINKLLNIEEAKQLDSLVGDILHAAAKEGIVDPEGHLSNIVTFDQPDTLH
jgi:hypothetical protein